MSVYIKEMTSR